MEGTNPLRLYCALVWWRPGRVRTQEETFPGSRNPSSQCMPYASASADTACTPDADAEADEAADDSASEEGGEE